jgi:hypothetical protein
MAFFVQKDKNRSNLLFFSFSFLNFAIKIASGGYIRKKFNIGSSINM